MPFSHHSHSGQFCGHATNTLEEMVQAAIRKDMKVFALTEHMPRDEEDFYPEEKSQHTASSLRALFAAYHAEASRLRAAYAPHLHILISFETEWIRPSSLALISSLFSSPSASPSLSPSSPPFDFLLGSLHHVHTIPIDYSRPLYHRARSLSGNGSDAALFAAYFDAQHELLTALRPGVVGHFDVVRLFSDDPDGEGGMKRWGEEVWGRVRRNLAVVRAYGGLVEVNAAGWRKGLKGPYPGREICEEFLAMGGRFTISDDSHGVEQVGTNYWRLPGFLEEVGIEEVWYLRRVEDEQAEGGYRTVQVCMKLEELREHTSCRP